jgi:hypothetical protein
MRFLAIGLLILSAIVVNAQEPWLAKHEQMRMRRLMPEGVPVSERLKFYRLSQVYQSRVELNGAPTLTIRPVSQHIKPWSTSGGMHHVPTSEWRNVTGLDVPEGKKILVWIEHHNGYALAPLVPRYYWQFPVGTVAYDVLIRRGEVERVFEVRTQERTKDGWSDSTAYRPDVEIPEQKPQGWKWSFVNEFMGESGFTFNRTTPARTEVFSVPPIEGEVKFISRKEVINDGGNLIPKDYAGTGMSCMACHNSQVVGAATGYGEALRGNDGRFSWHPFNAAGKIDDRWLIERYKR